MSLETVARSSCTERSVATPIVHPKAKITKKPSPKPVPRSLPAPAEHAVSVSPSDVVNEVRSHRTAALDFAFENFLDDGDLEALQQDYDKAKQKILYISKQIELLKHRLDHNSQQKTRLALKPSFKGLSRKSKQP